MTETKQTVHSCSEELLSELRELIDELTMELRFRGCDDNHRLIRRARALREKIKGRANS